MTILPKILVLWLLLASPAFAQQFEPPPGTVSASATMVSQLKGTLGSWSGGRVRKSDCGRAIPQFWRADMGWVRTSYSCGR